MSIVTSILYFIALWIMTTTFFNNFYTFKDRLQQKYIWNSTTTILSNNYLDFKNVEFTGASNIKPIAFSWVWEKIYIKLTDSSINTSWLDSYSTITGIRNNLTWMCLKYLAKNESLFYICKLQQ